MAALFIILILFIGLNRRNLLVKNKIQYEPVTANDIHSCLSSRLDILSKYEILAEIWLQNNELTSFK